MVDLLIVWWWINCSGAFGGTFIWKVRRYLVSAKVLGVDGWMGWMVGCRIEGAIGLPVVCADVKITYQVFFSP